MAVEEGPVTPTTRCSWAPREPLIAYHDQEWGVPLYDARRLFESLILEGAQAGLSWETVLKKRDAYRVAFDGFDPVRIARYDEIKIASLLTNPGIVRNRLKIQAAVANARAFLEIEERGGFPELVWSFVEGRPRQPFRRHMTDIPAQTPESASMSRELRRRGFKFVGPTICYAFMQATGMVNDHTLNCFRHRELAAG